MKLTLPKIGFIICIILVIAWLAIRSNDTPTLSPDAREEVNANATRSLRFDQSKAKLQNTPQDRSTLSEMALEFEDVSIKEREAVDLLYGLLSSLRIVSNKGNFPAGLNVEITNALLGDNHAKIGYLPADYARINGDGELIDKYGTPYWIHTLSSKSIEIRSAGPDKVLFSDDDISSMDE